MIINNIMIYGHQTKIKSGPKCLWKVGIFL